MKLTFSPCVCPICGLRVKGEKGSDATNPLTWYFCSRRDCCHIHMMYDEVDSVTWYHNTLLIDIMRVKINNDASHYIMNVASNQIPMEEVDLLNFDKIVELVKTLVIFL